MYWSRRYLNLAIELEIPIGQDYHHYHHHHHHHHMYHHLHHQIELESQLVRNVLGNNTLGEILSERESIARAIKVEIQNWPR